MTIPIHTNLKFDPVAFLHSYSEMPAYAVASITVSFSRSGQVDRGQIGKSKYFSMADDIEQHGAVSASLALMLPHRLTRLP
jgi:hypothetical protein